MIDEAPRVLVLDTSAQECRAMRCRRTSTKDHYSELRSLCVAPRAFSRTAPLCDPGTNASESRSEALLRCAERLGVSEASLVMLANVERDPLRTVIVQACVFRTAIVLFGLKCT